MSGKKLYAFDRDQTVETSEGPIPLDLIRRLVKEGAIVYAIGNVLLCDEISIPYAEGETKVERVRNLRKKYPNLDEYILIDDGEIEVQGFKHYTPDEFLKTIKW